MSMATQVRQETLNGSKKYNSLSQNRIYEKLITCFKAFLQDWQVLNHYTYFNKIKNFNSLLIFHLLKTSKEE